MMKHLYHSLFICMIATSLRGQLVISSPGDYDLGISISGSTGILINASNVTLNLNQQIVSSSANGITIAAGINNVIIQNGTISTASNGLVINQNCSNIFVSDLLIQNCTMTAIQVIGTSPQPVQRCNFKNINITNCFTSGSGSPVGIDINFAHDLRFEDIYFVSNGVSSLTQLTGVSIVNSQRCTLNNVQIKNCTGTTFIGISCGDATDNCVFNSCLVLDNLGTSVCNGFLISSATATNHFLNKCIVANNISNGINMRGFQLANASDLGLFACQAYSNLNSASNANCYGFYCDQLSQCSFESCQAFVNRATGSGTSTGAGFFVGTIAGGTTGVKNCGFFNNLAFANNGNSDAQSYGFQVQSAAGGNVTNTYVNNKAIRNGPTTPVVANQIINDILSPGGVPNASITDRTLATLNTAMDTDLSNIRIT